MSSNYYTKPLEHQLLLKEKKNSLLFGFNFSNHSRKVLASLLLRKFLNTAKYKSFSPPRKRNSGFSSGKFFSNLKYLNDVN